MSLLNAKNVSDERTFAAVITQVGGDIFDRANSQSKKVGPYVDTHVTAAEGVVWANGNTEFDAMTLTIKYRELLPNQSEERFMEFRLTDTQREAVLRGEEPSIAASSSLGRFVLQLDKLGLPGADDSALEGEVLVITRKRREVERGGKMRTNITHDVLASVGTENDWDAAEAERIIAAAAAPKRELASVSSF